MAEAGQHLPDAQRAVIEATRALAVRALQGVPETVAAESLTALVRAVRAAGAWIFWGTAAGELLFRLYVGHAGSTAGSGLPQAIRVSQAEARLLQAGHVVMYPGRGRPGHLREAGLDRFGLPAVGVAGLPGAEGIAGLLVLGFGTGGGSPRLPRAALATYAAVLGAVAARADTRALEAGDFAAPDSAGAARTDTQRYLQGLADEVRGIFGTDLCLVQFMLPAPGNLLAASGTLPPPLAAVADGVPNHPCCIARRTAEQHTTVVVGDLVSAGVNATTCACLQGGLLAHAAVPLIEADGAVVGNLCLLHSQPIALTAEQKTLLAAFGRALAGWWQGHGAQAVAAASDPSLLPPAASDAGPFVLTFGLDRRVKSMNRVLRMHLGYDSRELANAAPYDCVVPEDWERITEAMDMVARGGRVINLVVRHRSRSGELTWVEWTAVRRPDSQTVYCTGRDVTERRKAEALLQAHLRILKTAVRGEPLAATLDTIARLMEMQSHGARCGILMREGNRLTLMASPSLPAGFRAALERLAGDPALTPCGRAAHNAEPVIVTDLIADPDWPAFRAVALRYGLHSCWSMPVLAANGDALGTLTLYWPAPRQPSSYDWHLLETARQLISLAIERQSVETERTALLAREHEARAEAEASGRHLAFLAEASTVLASSLDCETILTGLAQLAAPRIADYCLIDVAPGGGLAGWHVVAHRDSGREQQLRALPGLDPLHPGISPFAALLSGNRSLLVADLHTSPEGARLPEAARPVLWDLQINGFVSVAMEIRCRTLGVISLAWAESGRRPDKTDLALAEDLARRASLAVDNALLYAEAQLTNARLEQRVKERTAELEQARSEMEAFTYSVSHDLRAPLRSMDGFSRILLDDYGERLDETGREYLHRVRAGGRRMAQLIDDLLNLSRLTNSPINRQSVDLSELATTVMADLRRRDPDRLVDAVIAPGVQAWGDPRLLRVVLENLLENAWKFTARQSRARIELGVVEEKGRPVYFVRDDGAGFDMAHADKLFQPFQRLHQQSEFPGMGIGLATVQRIIRRHGGEVWAEAEVGLGGTLYFTLPTSDNEEDSNGHHLHPAG